MAGRGGVSDVVDVTRERRAGGLFMAWGNSRRCVGWMGLGKAMLFADGSGGMTHLFLPTHSSVEYTKASSCGLECLNRPKCSGDFDLAAYPYGR